MFGNSLNKYMHVYDVVFVLCIVRFSEIEVLGII